ncbi:hypothetical protein LCGC14_0726680 [marine sediment metagenome]|uniref:Uncharacterized protein n=1 Tax=marine sediment metagenome TaxID=412755 RepID=A0A0F9QVU6_9ZZZZ
MDWSNILLAMLAAAGFAASGFWKNWFGAPTPKPPFDLYKFVATIVVGAGIGLVGVLMGVTITEQYLIGQLVSYVAVVTLVENILKGIIRALGKRWPTSHPTP